MNLVASLFCLCLVVALPHAAYSQPAAEPQNARSLFQQADDALREGRFAEARDMLRSSLDLHYNRGTVFNLAVALRGTGEVLAARALLDKLLQDKSISDAQRVEVRTLRDAVSREIFRLSLTLTRPSSASVWINGSHLAQIEQNVPLSHELDPGTKQIEVRAEGYIDHVQQLEAARGDDTSLEIALRSEQVTLTVVARNPAHTVAIVGVEQAGRALTRRLPPGKYRVRVIDKNRYHERELDLAAGTSLRVELEMPKKPLARRPWFWVAMGLATGAAATGTYFLVRPGTKPAVSDDVFGTVQALSR